MCVSDNLNKKKIDHRYHNASSFRKYSTYAALGAKLAACVCVFFKVKHPIFILSEATPQGPQFYKDILEI